MYKRQLSISVSGHKFGLVYPGLGWVCWKGKEYLPEEMSFSVNYPVSYTHLAERTYKSIQPAVDGIGIVINLDSSDRMADYSRMYPGWFGIWHYST